LELELGNLMSLVVGQSLNPSAHELLFYLRKKGRRMEEDE
jgi:hypothetical protein